MITSWIARKLGEKTTENPIAPDAPFYAIGDIHGRLDLLQRLLDRLDSDLPMFCVGDYVDRGEHSAGVLRFLRDTPAITCIKGNHEAMLLDFLDAPTASGPHWLRNGGLQTLASFAVTGLFESTKGSDLEQARDALATAMGDDLITWLRNLPLYRQTGNVAIVHAGADPTADIADQREDFMLWGHSEFTRTRRSDGLWVVHGHTITDTPVAENGRIAIDTGAFATGRLTAARIARDNVKFIST